MKVPDFSSAHVLVVGDVMLDRYWFGEVERISPEAPVPVIKVERVEDRAGGAANVARNIAALGAKTTLLSVVGKDEAGQSLEKLVESDGVDAILHKDASISTTIKLRAIARHQQLLRIDFETPPSFEILESVLADFGMAVEKADVVILSDYGKGGLGHIESMIDIANNAGKPVLVDPKGEDYSKYRRATLITPNRSEFRQVAGSWKSESELEEKAQNLRKELELEALLVTRSEDGMSLFREEVILHEGVTAKEVYDVSGAGDTVIATFGTMLAAGASFEESMRMANRAAGIVVGKLGTAVVTREELENQEKA
ncbi:MAG TPA: D-glycero-beta-D-manno-heptose-7-phosphate kinase [Burkholderiales bacterium]|nr:D-glycero-beta-D-manno-heptose-7-phosphate kinase [Burkholderiales bacterium]